MTKQGRKKEEKYDNIHTEIIISIEDDLIKKLCMYTTLYFSFVYIQISIKKNENDLLSYPQPTHHDNNTN